VARASFLYDSLYSHLQRTRGPVTSESNHA
jgi:hypothetical protein